MSIDDHPTYYLLQQSRTGYTWVTIHATRDLSEAQRKADNADDRVYHYRILDARTNRVVKVNRPGWVD
jgi:hypothetical protein